MPAPGQPGPIGHGVTYVLRAGETDYYKIGFTRGSVDRRLIELQSGCPWRLHLVDVLQGIHFERQLHKLWADHRMYGEWFELPDYTTARLREVS